MNKIKLFVMDVDGTLTDGSINISPSGELFKVFNVKDGMGIKMLQDSGIHTAIITGRSSEIVSFRAKELHINDVLQNISDKKKVLTRLMTKYGSSSDETVYVGDDINDLEAMSSVKYSFCPADATPLVKNNVWGVLESKGGKGAIRECVEWVLEHNSVNNF